MIKQLYYLLLSFAKNKYITILNKSISSLELKEGLSLIDVGAAGEIMPRWKRVESHLNYHGFEPDERSRKKLLTKQNKSLSYQIYDKIVADKEDTIDLYLCKTPTNSSTYQPNKAFNDLFSDKDRFEVIKTTGLPATTLDQLEIQRADFIKLDIQGGELNALKGGSNLLKSVLGLEIEIEFLHIYKKQPLFNEVTSFMEDNHFEFIDFPRLVRWDRDNVYSTIGQCVWGDALYMRTPEYIIKNIQDIDVVKRYLAICLLYHRYDLIKVIESHFNDKISAAFFNYAKKLRTGFLKNQLRKRRTNNLINLFYYFDEEIHSLH